jgi:hypothetical protein
MIYLVGEILAMLIFLCIPSSIYETGRKTGRPDEER